MESRRQQVQGSIYTLPCFIQGTNVYVCVCVCVLMGRGILTFVDCLGESHH